MARCDEKDEHRVISARPVTVGAAAAAEMPELLALPADVFEAGPTVSVKANHKSEVCVRQCYYSVPVSYAGRRLSVRVGARLIEVFADGKRIAAHVRAVHKYDHVLELDHYLEVLTRKPGAMAGATALIAARASGAFTNTHQRFWDKARHHLGDGPGTRALIGALLLARTLAAVPILEAMESAITVGDYDPDHLAIAARANAALPADTTALPEVLADRIVHLPERIAPSLAGYDQLLTAAGAR